MDSFLHQVALSITEKIPWQQLNRTTLVLPSHRAGTVLKNELLALQQQSGQQAIWAPKVQTLTQLQDSLSPLYAEDELMSIMRLYRHYTDDMPADMFYGWGKQMLADFTNIDASMPAEEVPNFFANTIAAHELSRWQLDAEVEQRLRVLMAAGDQPAATGDSIRRQYEDIWQQLYELYRALRAEMAAEQKGYAGMRQRAVIEHWDDESVQQQIAGRTFIFVGFNYLLPVERELMERLRDAGQAMFYWDYVAGFKTNEKAFSFAELNSRILGNAMPSTRALPFAGGKMTVVSCVSRESQAQYVHRWLRANYTAHGERVGVVICDETMLEPVIYALPAIRLNGDEQAAPVNITKGFPLRNTPLYAEAMRWLSDRARGKAEQAVAPELIDEMLAYLFPVKDIQEIQETQDAEETDDAMSWQELLNMESAYQVRTIANQMRHLIAEGLGGVRFTLRLLRLLMRRTMESVTMPFHGEPMTDIQVMGVLETRMLDFDKLLILNVEEGIIPQRQNDLSFIPYHLRKTYHMQTADERATVYAYNFFRLLSRAGEATLLFGSADTAEGGKGMSRFIMQMLVSPEFTIRKMRLEEAGVPATAPLVEETGVSLMSMLQTDERQRIVRRSGKPYRLSPSALNTYITCPRSFYLQYILGLRPQPKEDTLFAANTLGLFVHHALQYIYTAYMGCDNSRPQAVMPEQIEAVRTDTKLMEQALEAAYRAMNDEWLKDHPDEPEHYIIDHHMAENTIILGYMSNVLVRDREDAHNGLQIYLLEQNRTFPLMIEGIGSIETGGQIDRLDIYGKEQQILRVIDYKSGGYNDTTHAKKMSSTMEELFSSPDKGYVRQTLLYSTAVAAHERMPLPIEPHLYFCSRNLTEIDTYISLDQQKVTDVRSLEAGLIPVLANKVREILTTTTFPQCAEGECPSYCLFFTICGRAQTY